MSTSKPKIGDAVPADFLLAQAIERINAKNRGTKPTGMDEKEFKSFMAKAEAERKRKERNARIEAKAIQQKVQADSSFDQMVKEFDFTQSS